ncbi:Bromodomain-containing protein 1, partial [Trichinella pseudospiralis]
LEEEKCLRKIASQCSEKAAFINDIKRELGVCIGRKRRSEKDANDEHAVANTEITGNNDSVCDEQSTKLDENAAAHVVSLLDETVCSDGVNFENAAAAAAASTADNDGKIDDASQHSSPPLLSANALMNGQNVSQSLPSPVVDRQQQQHTVTGYGLNDDNKANENNNDSSGVKFSGQEVKKRPGRPRKRRASTRNPASRATRQKSLHAGSVLEASTTLNGIDEPSPAAETSALLNIVPLANSEAANCGLKEEEKEHSSIMLPSEMDANEILAVSDESDVKGEVLSNHAEEETSVLKMTNDDEVSKSNDLQLRNDEPVADEPIADEFVFEMLDLVWAKRSTMPWFPGMIVDPDMPRTGFTGKLADIPSPPEDVLQLKPNDGSYLVMLFNSMHTWNWLPKRCLKPLGLDISISYLDKLSEMSLVTNNPSQLHERVICNVIGFVESLLV